jgi:hypothetical protein
MPATRRVSPGGNEALPWEGSPSSVSQVVHGVPALPSDAFGNSVCQIAQFC